MKTVSGPYTYLLLSDLSASFLGPSYESRDYYGFGMEIIVHRITNLTGVFSVQHSNDATNWFTSNLFGPISLSALATDKNYGFSGFGGTVTEVYMIPWYYTRWNWTRSAGTGTATFILAANRL